MLSTRMLPLLLLIVHWTALSGVIDLNQLDTGLVLETRKIEIPGYPHAFNPSIIRWRGALLLSFREIPNPKTPFTSWIGLAWLDEDFQVIGTPQKLDTEAPNLLVPSRAEDARLLVVGDELYMVYSDCRDAKISKGGFRVYLARLSYDGERFSVHDIESLTRYEGASAQVREKNWVPFDFGGTLLLAYRLKPHRIFLPWLGTGECETIASSEGDVSWDWGDLRGGTPGLPVDDTHYLAFFHSCRRMASAQSNNVEMLHYFMGAYTYSRTPPFQLTAISTEPLIAEGFYGEPVYKPYWHPIRAVFPCGYVIIGEDIWIAYGRQDHELWMARLNKQQLLDSLVPVTTIR